MVSGLGLCDNAQPSASAVIRTAQKFPAVSRSATAQLAPSKRPIQ
jgi:hypothetical protein